MVFHDHILIFDFGLLNLNSKRKIFKFVSNVAYNIQTKIINTFFVKYKKSYKG
jgi:16S rRNA A1518/A1519 N6-dimethyltransferase RsmA/KsgA/DIM1 with predicted DNA glycosylase/AP lyase activity